MMVPPSPRGRRRDRAEQFAATVCGGLDPVGASDPSLPMRGSFVSPPLAEVYWGQLSDRG